MSGVHRPADGAAEGRFSGRPGIHCTCEREASGSRAHVGVGSGTLPGMGGCALSMLDQIETPSRGPRWDTRAGVGSGAAMCELGRSRSRPAEQGGKRVWLRWTRPRVKGVGKGEGFPFLFYLISVLFLFI
jgi:hypothetical protein